MAMNLKNLKGASGNGGGAEIPVDEPRKSSQAKRFDPRYGRRTDPPPRGSSYAAYLEWASEGGIPFQDDVDLAVQLWMEPAEDEAPSGPGMR